MRDTEDRDDPRRRVLVQALGLGFLGAAMPGGRAWGASLFGDRPGKLPPGQSVYRMEGRVTVNDRPVTMGTTIAPGDEIRTGKDGELVFVLGAQAMLVRGDSHLKLEKKDEKGISIATGFRLLTGKLLSVFGRGNAQVLRTPTSTIGIRGTGVYVEADPEQTYFCTCYGTTDIESSTDRNARKTIRARHHDQPVYILAKGRDSQFIVPAPFINHTDQELMLIETLVGREPPFVFPSQDYGGPRRDY